MTIDTKNWFKKMSDKVAQAKNVCLQIFDKIKPTIIQHKKRFLVIASSVVVIMVFLYSYISFDYREVTHYPAQAHAVKKTMSPQNYVSQQLNDITIKLANIETNLSDKHTVVDLDPIRSDIASLVRQTQQLSNQSNHLLTQQINSSTKELEKRLTTLNRNWFFSQMSCFQRSHLCF